MNAISRVKTLTPNKHIYFTDWVTCEEYEIMGFIFRVGVNNQNPGEVGLFVHRSDYWIKMNTYSWSTIEDTMNDFIPFLIKKDITNFLLKHFNLNTTRTDRRFLIENEILKEEIFEILKNSDSALSVSDIVGYLEDVTYQRVAALLIQMVNNDIIQKVKIEKKSYFKY